MVYLLFQTKKKAVLCIEMYHEVGYNPNIYSIMMLVGARLIHISTTKWGTRQYLNTCKFYKTA